MKRGFERHIGKIMSTMRVEDKIFESLLPNPNKRLYAGATVVNNSKLLAVKRVGKHLITSWESWRLETFDIVVSPRMTGNLIWNTRTKLQEALRMMAPYPGEEPVYDTVPDYSDRCRVAFIFEDGIVEYQDVRGFGRVRLINSWLELDNLRTLGRDLLDDECDLGYVLSKVNQRIKHSPRATVKTFLLDQTEIAGIGNYMASEILYTAQVRPGRYLSDISVLDWQRILSYAKNLASLLISVGGVTLRDYNTFDGTPGGGAKLLQVYGKDSCPLGHPISRIKLANRTTYFCEHCQE